VLAAIAFTLSCLGLMIFVWTQFGGTVPFAAQGYRVNALFTETGLLVPNADVRIAGVNVGKVTNVQARGVNSYVTMDLQSQYAPIPGENAARRGLHRALDGHGDGAEDPGQRHDPLGPSRVDATARHSARVVQQTDAAESAGAA
jgi:hypothetical protein